MKSKHYIIASIALGIMIAMTSCEDYLYQEPRLQQTNELSLSTFDGLQKATLGAYTPLYHPNWYGRNYIVYGDLKGGNAKISPLNSGRFRTTYLWNATPTSAPPAWTQIYELIARANNVINAIEGGFEEAGVPAEELDRLAAECKFLRALGHFDLARLYCQPYTQGEGRDQLGVPVVLESELGEPERDDLGTVYDQVVTDLEDAMEALPAVSPNEGTDPSGWATRYAAQALLARVSLYMGEWQLAADYATRVIDNFPGRLYSAEECNTWDNGGVWGTDNAAEIIFEVYGDEGNSSHGNWDVISYIMSPEGYGDVGASLDVVDLYEENDARKNLFTNTADYPNDYWSLKYPGKGPSGNLREDNIPVLRLSEMYLIRAEALLNGASVAGADPDSDLNAIRTRRNATPVVNATLQDVYTERRLELCFEGHQLFDLARTGRDLERTDFEGAVNQNISFPDYRWAMPIPQEEVDANANMQQNPGYISEN